MVLKKQSQDTVLIGVLNQVALFGHHKPASNYATSLGLIRCIYAEAIEYTTTPSRNRGLMFLIWGIGCFLMGLIPCGFMWLVLQDELNMRGGVNWFVIFTMGPMFFLCLAFSFGALLIFGAGEFFRPLDLPIIFDRRRRAVYRMVYEGTLLGGPGKARLSVLEYDWNDISASHAVRVISPGNGVASQKYHSMWLLVCNKRRNEVSGEICDENRTSYREEFGFGGFLSLNEHNIPSIWEHLRRYMNENGPALPPGEQLADTTVPVTWWDSLGAVSVFGSGYVKRWRSNPILMTFMHVIGPITMPLAVLMATTNWASYKTAYPVQWPQEVLDKIGPPVRQG